MDDRESNLTLIGPLDPRLSLGEGNTPCIPSRLGRLIRGIEILLKLETRNPFGSMLDRGVAACAAWALRSRCHLLVTTDADLAAPLAAYAARAGLRCLALLPTDAPDAALQRARRHGARVLRVAAERVELLSAARELDAARSAYLVERDDAIFLEGLQTLADELADVLSASHSLVVMPPAAAAPAAALAQRLRARRRARNLPCDELLAAVLDGACGTMEVDSDGVAWHQVDPRDAEAAHQLACAEEGLLLGARSAAALALGLQLGRAARGSIRRLVVIVDDEAPESSQQDTATVPLQMIPAALNELLSGG